MQSELAGIWKTEIEILDEIADVCKKHNLKYSLAYGTLLGAVRHQGFIPWDDDVDIIMPRDDYRRLVSIWEKASSDDYLLVNKEKYDDFSQNFTKIVRNHTTFIEFENEKKLSYPKGIFVDIFPVDCMPHRWLLRKIQFAACAIELLYSREYTSKDAGSIKIAERILLSVPHEWRLKIRKAANRFIQRWKTGHPFCHQTIKTCKQMFPSCTLSGFTTASFCGKEYQTVQNAEALLRLWYGDYETLPPESERVLKHHPILVDFSHNYEELIGHSENL